MLKDTKKKKLNLKATTVKTILYKDLSVVTGGGCRIEAD
jgi:hypothetical protein